MAVRRIAFDIGSGATKIQVADVEDGRIVKELLAKEVSSLAKDLPLVDLHVYTY